MKKQIKLTHGKHFFGDCGSSNWREAGEVFDAEMKEIEEYGIKSIIATVRTPSMQHSIDLYNNEFGQEFAII
jgi:hypothetical protein